MTKALASALALLALTATPLAAQEAAPTLQQARASLAGEWAAELQYRDYQSGDWVPIPFTTSIAMVGDGRTQIVTSAYDDGPSGTVWITTVSLLAADNSTEQAATFRVGRPATFDTWTLTLTGGADAAHWTIVAQTDSTDANRPATLRETTTRDGDTVTTLKEVDFTDDAASEWLVRNRTILRRPAG